MPHSHKGVGTSQSTPYRATGASLVAIIVALLCFGAVMLLHVLRGEINPIRRVMSEYANGSHGLIMTVVFYAFGVSSLALAFRLRRGIDRRGITRISPLLDQGEKPIVDRQLPPGTSDLCEVTGSSVRRHGVSLVGHWRWRHEILAMAGHLGIGWKLSLIGG